MDVTHPDISYLIHSLNQFVSTPTSIHYTHHICVLQYLRGTLSSSLLPTLKLIDPFMLIVFFLVVLSLLGSTWDSLDVYSSHAQVR